MQINRLFKIVYLLLENKTMTAKELAERFEVSTRTVYRDIDVLSGAGIPVYASKGRSGGIGLLPDFILNKSLLTAQEQNEILFALQGLLATKASEDDAVFEKMRGFFKRDGDSWIEIDFSNWGSSSREHDKFETIKTGILEARVLGMDYHGSNGECTVRLVEPYKLLFKHGSWYLQAYCRKRKDFRFFKVLRMEQVTLTKERFIRQELAPPKAGKTVRTAPLMDVLLWFPPEMAYRVYDDFDRSSILVNKDGSFLVNYRCLDDEWTYNHILSFQEKVRVLDPPEVKARLKQRLEKILRNYQ